MTLQELITDLKAAGANDNTLHLALNCYELGKADARKATWTQTHWTEYENAIAVAALREGIRGIKLAWTGEDMALNDALDPLRAAIRARGTA